MSDPAVSEELLSIANTAYFQCRGNDVEKLRAALEAIASRLKAEGLREVATELERRAYPNAARIVRARADALFPQAKETK